MSNTSTAIRAIEHNPESNEMLVTFQSGQRYRYDNVDRKTAEEFAQADSKGRFFNTRLGGLYYAGTPVV